MTMFLSVVAIHTLLILLPLCIINKLLHHYIGVVFWCSEFALLAKLTFGCVLTSTVDRLICQASCLALADQYLLIVLMTEYSHTYRVNMLSSRHFCN